MFMQQYADQWSIEEMAAVLNVSRSGYYQYINRTPSKRRLENERLLTKIKTIHETSRKTYGSPRVHAELLEEGELCSRKRVANIMRQAGIVAKMRKKFKVTTRVNPDAVAAPNLLQQDFTADKPNQKWVADFTYVFTLEGWLYVATVLDLFSRRIIGLSMSDSMTTDLVASALQQALIHRNPPDKLIHHSDRGVQYTSHAFRALLKNNNIIASMSSTGNCYDNATMESFYHTLKTEHVYFELYKTREEAKNSIFEYVEVFYNRKRRHSTLGYYSPVTFEKKWQQGLGVSIPTVH
jgi:putative transposase